MMQNGGQGVPCSALHCTSVYSTVCCTVQCTALYTTDLATYRKYTAVMITNNLERKIGMLSAWSPAVREWDGIYLAAFFFFSSASSSSSAGASSTTGASSTFPC